MGSEGALRRNHARGVLRLRAESERQRSLGREYQAFLLMLKYSWGTKDLYTSVVENLPLMLETLDCVPATHTQTHAHTLVE